MRKPKHIRQAKAAKIAAANLSYQEAKATGTLERTGHSVLGGANGVHKVNMGFRMSPDLKQGYRFRNPMNAKGAKNKRGLHSVVNITEYVDRDGKTKQFKYYTQQRTSVTDSELYDMDTRPAHKDRGEAKIRVGTTPSRMVPMTDKLTGETKVVRVRAKGKFQDVGLPGCIPKDGGK